MRTFEQHEKAIVKIIEENKDVLCNEDIFKYYKWLKIRQFYNLRLHESQSVRNALEDNRLVEKSSMRRHWRDPDANPTLQLAAYKLMATPEEREALSTNAKIEANVKGDVGIMIDFKE